ncbi:hypothetical protein BH09PLA1_BH09PLA1_36720 [soil metagenome]
MYDAFRQLDGNHPWRKVSAHGFVDDRARRREGGRVIYFNFDRARELALVPANHANQVTPALEKVILESFALQIINEYDEQNNLADIPRGKIAAGKYMATRYLQAQHKDKRGLTSGDGRAIWNGQIKTAKLTFDVSSRGTGATRLSPGAQLAGCPVKTGDDSYGYSCGQAELDEMLGTAMMSEIFYRNGLPTERTLAVIDFGDKTAIGVRTAPNLIRPAHIFRYLKQSMHSETRQSLEFFFDRQVENGFWKLPTATTRRYRKALEYIAQSYGKLAAVLEEEYIFNWLAWDGDNMLASGAILDYGSIRQFAAKHDKYRYDDVDRFSSSLTEQRYWARELVKVFAQAMHFALTKKRLPLSQFKTHKCLATFDRAFNDERDRRLLWRIGFADDQTARLMKNARNEIQDLRRAMAFFEDQKIARGMEKLSDGVTHSPVFLIRSLLRRLPAYYASEAASQFGALMPAEEFCTTMAASYVSRRDMRLTPARIARTKNFQKCYQRLLAAAGDYPAVLKSIVERSAVINHPHRMTGNAMILVVDEVIAFKDKLSRAELQAAMEAFIESQVLIPGRWKPIPTEEMNGASLRCRLLRAFQADLEECKETV